MKKSYEKGEIMRIAQRLLKYRRAGALKHATKMVERMKEEGDEENQAFWERIYTQIDLLHHELPPD